MTTPDDLTTTPAVKQWLGMTSSADDAVIDGLVSSVSRAILADLGRSSVLPSTYVETFDGGSGTLALRHWPVTQVVSLTAGGAILAPSAGAAQSGYVLEVAEVAPPGTMQRLCYSGGTFPRGRQSIAVTYRAGYEILRESATVPAVAPFVMAAAAPFGPWRIDTGVTGAASGYTALGGVYTFPASAAGQGVTLSYGYVPNDLVQAAIEWVADRYAARTRIGQSAKTLGGQETTSFIVKAIPDAVNRLLQPYRRVAR